MELSKDTPLVRHARRELDLAGLLDSEENKKAANCAIELMQILSNQGHEGQTGAVTIDLFFRLSQYKNLSPLTSLPEEWTDRSETNDGKPFWQNKRNLAAVSEDGGKSYYLVTDRAQRTEPTLSIEEAEEEWIKILKRTLTSER